MQVTVEDAGSNTKRLKISLEGKDVQKEIEKAYRKLSSQVSIKGFRKGKVPRQVLQRNYASSVEQEVGEKLIQDTYFDALAESKLDAVVHPEIRSQAFEEDGSFVYEAEIAVRPDFGLDKYKGLKIETEETIATDEEIDVALQTMRREKAPLRSVDGRGIEQDDVVVVDFQGYHDGKEMPQVKAENYTIDIGSGRFGDEFEKNLLGLKKDEETIREMDFPAGFPNPVLAEKKVEFKIKVRDIKEKVVADLDDEFAKDAGDEYNTLDDLKKVIGERITKEKEDANAGALADKLMIQLLDAHDFDVPARLVAAEINSLIKEMEDNLTNQNMTLESAGLNRDDLVEQYKETATKRVKGDFILKKIAEVEDIKLVDEDIERGFQRISEHYNMPIEEVKKYFANRDDLMPFMNELLSEKIINFLKDNAEIKKIKPEAGVKTKAKAKPKAKPKAEAKSKPKAKAKPKAKTESKSAKGAKKAGEK